MQQHLPTIYVMSFLIFTDWQILEWKICLRSLNSFPVERKLIAEVNEQPLIKNEFEDNKENGWMRFWGECQD